MPKKTRTQRNGVSEMQSKKEQSKWRKRDRKRSKRRHGMRVDRRPTDIGQALENRAKKGGK